MHTGKGNKVVHPRHCAIVFHDFTNHARRIETSKPADIDSGLRMASAHQNPAIACRQWKDVPRRNNIVRPHRGIHSNGYGACAVCGADACRNALTRFYGHGKGGLHAFAVFPRHRRQAKLFAARLGHGKADEATPMCCHEIDRVWRCHLRGDNQVALIFTIFIIDEDIHAAIARLFNDFLNRHERSRVIVREQIAFQLT